MRLAAKILVCTLITGPSVWSAVWVPAQKLTIQAAINSVSSGDTVIVADGTYSGPGNRDLDFQGKNIVLMSENGPEYTIIDCEGTETEPHRGFFFAPGDDADSVVDGFTIRKGYSERGGGVYCMIIANPTIFRCNITGNTATENGGGIYCKSFSGPAVVDSTITANSAGTYGGGISCEYGFLNITNCLITGNSAHNMGGGVYDAYSGSVISNCTTP